MKGQSVLLIVVFALGSSFGSTQAQQGTSSVAEATPFGLKQGMTRAQLGPKLEKLDAPGMYKLVTVPRPHPDFESYILQIGPTTGLCFVKGVGTDVATSVYGSELKSRFQKVRDQLVAVYGKLQETDMLLQGSIWDEPRDWMAGLLKKERLLFGKWHRDVGSSLKVGLREILPWDISSVE
jgi:hypothetical protein